MTAVVDLLAGLPARAAAPVLDRPSCRWWLLVPLALATAAYWRVLPGDFQFDDGEFIVDNAAIKDLSAFLTPSHWSHSVHSDRPVLELSFALNYAYGGLEPWNFHVTNLLIHLAAVVLAFAVARVLLRSAGAARAERQALAVAGVFALHPLQSGAVSYVWQRGESLAALFFLAGLLALLHSDEGSTKAWRPALLLGGVAAFVLGLGTKATVVAMPVAWLLLAWLVPSPSSRAVQVSWRRRLIPALIFLAIGAAYCVRLLSALNRTDTGPGTGLSSWTFLQTQFRVIPTYLRLLAWPSGQSVDWHLQPRDLLDGPATALFGVLLLVTAVGALRLALRARQGESTGSAAARIGGAGLLWFLLLLAPTSSVVPLIDLLVEHRLYLPSLGVFLAASVVAERALDRWAPPRLHAGLVVAIWLVLAELLHARNAVWESRRALWTNATTKNPDNPRAWENLAMAASLEGRDEEALAAWRRGLEVGQAEPRVRAHILGNIGIHLAQRGALEEAERSLRQGLELERRPNFEDALAAVMVSRGRLDEAESMLTSLLRGEPARVGALLSLAKIRLLRGDPSGALDLTSRALAVDPDVAPARFLHAWALEDLGRRAESCVELSKLPANLDAGLAPQVEQARRVLGCSGR